MKYQHMLIEKLSCFLEFVPDQDYLRDGLLEIDNLQIRVCQTEVWGQPIVTVMAQISRITPANMNTVLTLTMSANHLWRGTQGATFSCDPMTERLFLSRAYTCEQVKTMQHHEVGDEFLTVFDTAQHWKSVISQLDIPENDAFDLRANHALSYGQACSRLQ